MQAFQEVVQKILDTPDLLTGFRQASTGLEPAEQSTQGCGYC